jgi:hypothetical protein
MQFDHFRLINEADDRHPAFGELVADVALEEGSILPSEALFISLCVGQFEPLRIVQAGRGGGAGTEFLARSFPDLPVLSVDDRDDPAARERLARYENVQLEVGDPREVITRQMRTGDYLVMERPDGMEGLRLLLELFASRNFEMGFLHNAGAGSPARDFVQKHHPMACFADDPEFTAVTHGLDERAGLPQERSYAANEGRFGYGQGMICLPYDASLNYAALARKTKGGLLGRLFGR